MRPVVLSLLLASCAAAVEPTGDDTAGGPDDAAVVISREGCEGTWMCTDFGQCTNYDGNCIATENADCQDSLECIHSGLCVAAGGCCVLAADKAGCEGTFPFETTGRCPDRDPFCQAFAAGLSPDPSNQTPVFADVQPVLSHWCSRCHSGTDRTKCQGGTCLADVYEDSLLPSKFCEGKMTMLECAVLRLGAAYTVKAGPDTPQKLLSVENSVIILPRPAFGTLERWIARGMPR